MLAQNRHENQAYTVDMVSTGLPGAYRILLDNGGRTSTRNGYKSYNDETSREKKESVSGLFIRHASGTPLVASAHTFCTW